MQGQNTVLLFGMPRSGTTWIGKLFDAHRDTYYLHEPDSVQPDLTIPLLTPASASGAEALDVRVASWLKNQNEKVIASRPFFPKSYINPLNWSVFLGSAYLTKVFGRLGKPNMLQPIRMQRKAPVTVWKSIESVGRLAAIAGCLDAYAIHIIRHPCGHIASTLKGQDAGLFDGAIPIWEDWDLYDKLLLQSADARFSLSDIKAMSIEERLAVRWGIMNDYALAQSQHNQKSKVLIYEDLCREPAQEFANCLAFCGMAADKQSLDYLQQSISGDDSAYYGTKKSPLVSAYKWKKQLSSEVQQRIRQMVMQFNAGKYYQDDF